MFHDVLRGEHSRLPHCDVFQPIADSVIASVVQYVFDACCYHCLLYTSLIISGPAEQSAQLYYKVNQIIPRLKKDVDFTVDEKHHSAVLTDSGVEKVEKLLAIHNLYDAQNLSLIHI